MKKACMTKQGQLLSLNEQEMVLPVSVRDIRGSSKMLNRAGTARLKMSLSCREYSKALPLRPATVRIDSDPESARAVILEVLHLRALLGL